MLPLRIDDIIFGISALTLTGAVAFTHGGTRNFSEAPAATSTPAVHVAASTEDTLPTPPTIDTSARVSPSTAPTTDVAAPLPEARPSRKYEREREHEHEWDDD